MAATARTLHAICCTLLLSTVLADQRATVAAVVAVAAPAPLVAVPAVAPAPRPVTLHDKVVAALRASNHYGALSGFLDSIAASTIIKEGTTLFAPDDTAFSGLNMNSSALLTTTMDYHVATEIYNYQQLSNMALNATIQTSVPNVVILVTSTGTNGLRIDNVAISDPDIYADGQISVQGISEIMNTAKYNAGLVPPTPAPAPLVDEVLAPSPGVITTPSTPKTSTGTTPSKNAAPALALTTALNAVLPIFAVSFVAALW